MKKLKEDLYNMRYAIIALMAYFIFMKLIFNELCPIKALFKINCPGCGLTHAFIDLLQLKFIDAINDNYSIFLWITLFILFIIDRYIHKLNKYVVPVTFFITTIVTLIRYILLLILK